MRTAILNCDYDKNKETNGGERIQSILTNGGAGEISSYNVFENKFPDISELSTSDSIIITGSKASVYHESPWIKRLSNTIQDINSAKVPTFAICFGFQMVAKVFGGQVEPSGSFEEGFKTISLTPEGCKNFLFCGFPKQLSVYQNHGDIAKSIPKNSKLLAVNDFSLQAYEFENFFCVQFHPEILPKAAVKMALRDGKNPDDILSCADIDYVMPANVILNFLRYCK